MKISKKIVKSVSITGSAINTGEVWVTAGNGRGDAA
jgi:hypothetical protein